MADFGFRNDRQLLPLHLNDPAMQSTHLYDCEPTSYDNTEWPVLHADVAVQLVKWRNASAGSEAVSLRARVKALEAALSEVRSSAHSSNARSRHASATKLGRAQAQLDAAEHARGSLGERLRSVERQNSILIRGERRHTRC